MVIIALVLVVLLVPTAMLVARQVRRRRAPRELRGDWWAEFERQFRTYAERDSSRGGRLDPQARREQ